MLSLLCPPCPSKIVSKLAFSPPEPTYALIEEPTRANQDSTNSSDSNNCNEDSNNNQTGANRAPSKSSSSDKRNENPPLKYKLKLDEKAEWQYNDSDQSKFDVFYADSGKNERIACMYVKVTKNPKKVILFSHGNAADLGLMCSFYLGLGTKVECNIFGYDYSGYGASTGKPSEKCLYANIEAAYNELTKRYSISPSQIILYGQSIGTVPTVDLASKIEFAGVILHSPLTSGLRLAFPNTKRTWFFDAFPNIDKAPRIKAPTLVIHGTEDEIIDISHGQAIHSLLAHPVPPLWVEGAGHNDIELFREFLDRLRKFIYYELDKLKNRT